MPQPATATRPGSLTDTILQFYKQHPGLHRCMDVSPELEIPTHRLAVLSARLHERGLIERKHINVYGRTRPVSLYGITDQTVRPTKES